MKKKIQNIIAAILASFFLFAGTATAFQVNDAPISATNPIPSRSTYDDIARGNVEGHIIIRKFGRNAAVPNGSWAGILDLGTFNFLQAATTIRIKAGGNAADVAGGAGAQVVTVSGIDDSGNLVSEDIVTAGASASTATTALFWRVFRVSIPDSGIGAYGAANTGNIIIENSAGGTDLIEIAAGNGQSEYGSYSIPAGHTGYFIGGSISVNASKTADVRAFVRHNFNDVTTPFSPKLQKLYFGGVLGVVPLNPKIWGEPLPEYTDIWIEANGGGAATEVDIDFDILLIQDGF